ncbi:alpha-1A adrenergic receptor-like [Littorina saxatilis]|uniref:alpha-1A adrenergic receptor-like n=1 Tax=Littorina saxatilis TaxID=31220 RepID=UPI0038B65E46
MMTSLYDKLQNSPENDDVLNVTLVLGDVINITSHTEPHGLDPSLTPGHFWTLKILTAVLALLSLGFNTLALISILKYYYHFSVSCRFVFNLLVVDLLFSAIVLCREVLELLQQSSVSREVCVGFFSAILFTGSTVQLSLFLAVLDNFVAVMFPFRYRIVLTATAAHFAIGVTWVYGVAVMIVLPNLSVLSDWRSSSVCQLNRVFTAWFRALLVVQLGLVTVLLISLYLCVLNVAARHHRRLIVRGVEYLPEEEREKIREKYSHVQCKGLLVLSFFVCWVPFCLVQSLDSVFSPDTFTVLAHYASLFVLFNAAANPLVCVWRNRHFRVAVQSLLGMEVALGTVHVTVLSM